jgi:hypothetical protein
MEAPTPSRPQLTPALLLYLVVDLVGVFLFVTGFAWFVLGRSLFFESYPSSQTEAGIAVAGGLVMMIWSAPRIQRKLSSNVGRTPRSNGRP